MLCPSASRFWQARRTLALIASMMSESGQLRLPPEIWRLCMRWATLPTSGREPLDPPTTAMDKWPTEYTLPGNTHPNLGPENTYPWEQSRLYFTKRSLMLVCKEWEALAVEYMYESLVVELYGVGRERKLLPLLRTTKLGERFRWWVKRVDAHRQIHSTLARLFRDELPNAHVQHFWRPVDHLSHMEEVPHTKFSATFQSYTLSICPRHFHVACPSPIRPRHITLYLRGTDPLFNSPVEFPNLKYLAIITSLSLTHFGETLAKITKFWTCPVLTQLRINVWSVNLECPSLFPDLVFCYRKTLRYLEILAPITAATLHSILRATPDITSLVISAPLSMTLEKDGRLQHANLQTVGLAVQGPNTWTLMSNLGDREAFPSLSLVRIVTPAIRWTKPSLQPADFPLCLSATQLLKHGIKLEDCTGADLAPIFCNRDSSNQDECVMTGHASRLDGWFTP